MSSINRRDGYVIGVPYIDQVTTELCPAWFSMALMIHGQPPLPSGRVVTWVELGCGTGMTANVVAAANSNLEVWGCDFNADHVRRANELARAAQLENATFVEASFEEVATNATLGPPQVDVVVIHGVYSWVSREQQHHLASFIRQRLRPGGVAYLSYEVATGWASMVPIAEAMRLLTDADDRPLTASIFDAARSLRELAEGGARYHPVGPQEQSQLDSLFTADPRYAVHEYLGEHFRPLMFDEVADAMASAGCDYVGSIEPTDALSEFWVGPGLAELVSGTADEVCRGMLRDLATQRPLRRDLFRKGLEPTQDDIRVERLRTVRLFGLGTRLEHATLASIPLGSVELDPTYYEPLIAHLEAAPLDLDTAAAIRPEASTQELLQAMSLLVAAGFAAPGALTHRRSIERCRRLNARLTAENAEHASHSVIASPATGSGITVEWVESLLLIELLNGADRPTLTAREISELVDRQRRVLFTNRQTEVASADVLDEVAKRIESAERRQGLLRSNRILPAVS